MTRNAWVTVRLPGASTAPATRIRTCRQTGAVKQGRNTDSQAAKTGGGTGTVAVPGRFACIAVLESTPARAARVSPGATRASRAGYRLPHDRSDHSAYRDVPVPSRTAARRATQPWLYALSRDVRSARCQVTANRAGQSCRSSLLVPLEGAMDQ